ncbi:MAG: glycosyltransferase family 2 protein [Candidatus Electrothrix sp. Rat3]|nr:glycosyltransferase family 2 protein [Candidatus Electrothrix rattekaaiensis]
MIIYATMSVKDEADILSHTIENALTWIDKIFVVDNGSDDSTQEILKQYGDRVILLATFYGAFHSGLKSIPFNWVNSIQSYPQADWWCVMDADEVYFDNPRRFLTSVPEYFGQVCTNTIEFIGLKEAESPLEPSSYSHYIPIDWSETRFYRNTKALRWCMYSDNGP